MEIIGSSALPNWKGFHISNKCFFADWLCVKKGTTNVLLWMQDSGHGQASALALRA